MLDRREKDRIKKKLAKDLGLGRVPKDFEIFSDIISKPTRTLSGVCVVAVMSPPAKCPHGKCVYCPGGPEIESPQSYTGREPAALRGKEYGWDPIKQVRARLHQYHLLGHNTEKVEVIVMGGTFTARNIEEQRAFIKGIFDGLNGYVSKDLSEAMESNEKAKHRCVGLTIETRPDYCKEREINEMLAYGTTRVELGVQHPDDNIYQITKRGHTVADVIEATQRLRDAFLKINYHIMPNLPGSNPEKDVKMMKKIFSEPFMPDMLKIYPCVLVKPEYGKTELYDMWKKGFWDAYDEDTLIETLAKMIEKVPKFVRIMRIERDIPIPLILRGPKIGHLRQVVYNYMQEHGMPIREIRYREAGRNEVDWASVHLERIDYKAGGGKEVFLAFEDDNEILIGFLRLRLPYKPFRPEIDQSTAGIRELHVYGRATGIGKKGELQHRGFGKKLVMEAERIAKQEWGCEKILVISGVGVREYYRKLGYERVGPYMGKTL